MVIEADRIVDDGNYVAYGSEKGISVVVAGVDDGCYSFSG